MHQFFCFLKPFPLSHSPSPSWRSKRCRNKTVMLLCYLCCWYTLPLVFPAKLLFSPFLLISFKLLPFVPWNKHISLLPPLSSKLCFFIEYCLNRNGFCTRWICKILCWGAVWWKWSLMVLYSSLFLGSLGFRVTRWTTTSLPFASFRWASQYSGTDTSATKEYQSNGKSQPNDMIPKFRRAR